MAPAVNGVNGTKGQVNGVPSSWQSKHNLAPHFIGGNKLEKAPPSSVKDFVQDADGHSMITSVSTDFQLQLIRSPDDESTGADRE